MYYCLSSVFFTVNSLADCTSCRVWLPFTMPCYMALSDESVVEARTQPFLRFARHTWGGGDCLLRRVTSSTLVHFVDFLEAVLIDLFPFSIVCKPTCKSDQEKSRLNRNYCCHLLSWKLKLTVHICILLVLHTTYAYNKILSLLIRWVTGVCTSSVFKFSIWCLQITALESVVVNEFIQHFVCFVIQTIVQMTACTLRVEGSRLLSLWQRSFLEHFEAMQCSIWADCWGSSVEHGPLKYWWLQQAPWFRGVSRMTSRKH